MVVTVQYHSLSSLRRKEGRGNICHICSNKPLCSIWQTCTHISSSSSTRDKAGGGKKKKKKNAQHVCLHNMARLACMPLSVSVFSIIEEGKKKSIIYLFS